MSSTSPGAFYKLQKRSTAVATATSTQGRCDPLEQLNTPFFNQPIDIKPDNVLANNGTSTGPLQRSAARRLWGHFYGRPQRRARSRRVTSSELQFFRSPEAMLNLR